MINRSVTFRKIPTFQEAKETALILNEAGIETEIIDDVPAIDVTFNSRSGQNSVILKIKESDFETANEVIKAYDFSAIQNIEEDYYLLEFSDEELYDVIQNSEEWSNLDYLLAQSLLRDRGHTIDDSTLKKMKENRIAALSQPDLLPKSTLVVGYFFSIMGGFIGVIIGYSILSSKKYLPNGTQVSSYSEDNRKQGKNILYIGTACFIVVVLRKLFLMSNN